jgi:hypothetical protein
MRRIVSLVVTRFVTLSPAMRSVVARVVGRLAALLQPARQRRPVRPEPGAGAKSLARSTRPDDNRRAFGGGGAAWRTAGIRDRTIAACGCDAPTSRRDWMTVSAFSSTEFGPAA